MRTFRFTTLVFLLLLVVAPVACSGGQADDPTSSSDSTTLTVSGAFALFPMMTVWAEQYHQLNTEIALDVQAGGAGKGMTDVLTGAADIAMLSREARQEELDQGAFLVPVTIDAVVGTINAGNPYLADMQRQGLTPDQANAIWIGGQTSTWGQLLGSDVSEAINVYTRSDSAGAAEMWALYAGGEAQEDLIGTAVNGDPGLAEAVRQDQWGVGFNNIGFSYDQTTGKPIEGLQIMPLDLNGNGQIDAEEDFYETRDELTTAIADGRYPFPPARVLYLVTRGAPSQTIVDFYRWVLTDGQVFVPQTGYITLTEARIQEALAILANTAAE